MYKVPTGRSLKAYKRTKVEKQTDYVNYVNE